GVIRSAIGEYQPEVYEANSPAGETEGSSLVAARLLRTLDANGGHSRRSPWRAHGNGPRVGCAKIPSATVARIIRNFTDREGGSGIGQIRMFVKGGRRRRLRHSCGVARGTSWRGTLSASDESLPQERDEVS